MDRWTRVVLREKNLTFMSSHSELTSVAQHELYVALATVCQTHQLKMSIQIVVIDLQLKLSSPSNINFMGAQTFPFLSK